MCGIIAHLAFDDGARLSASVLSALNDLMRHRGPDDSGVFVEGPVTMAMRRLAIVDLGGGHQPMSTSDGRYTIVFNGEIYNHTDIRADLIAAGHSLSTHSDTETLLHAFAAWGPACLDQLNGMFAFAIWDRQDQSLFVARDRLGVKPLYYALDGRRIMFASELTPIARSRVFKLSLNLRTIAEYLSYWYICEPHSIFSGIQQLPPGHWARVRQGKMHVEPYWHVPAGPEVDIGFNDAAEQLDHLLNDAVRLRLNADVPYGTFLSGGIDSGIVTAMAGKAVKERLHSFAIGFADRRYDETPLARLTAARHGVDLHVHIMEQITPGLVNEIAGAFDEPLGNASYVPTYLLARAARQQMKVVLTGDGGDELFGGYPTYQAPYYQAMWRRLPQWARSGARRMVAAMPVSHGRISLDFRLKQLMGGIDMDYRRAHHSWREIANSTAQGALWHPDLMPQLDAHDPFSVSNRYYEKAGALSVVNQLMYTDIHTFLLNDHLRKVDRMTMAHGLEARSPFMDYRVVEFAMRLPAGHKVDLRRTKRILKEVSRAYLPPEVIAGKKKGLTSPIAGWISHDLKDFIRDECRGGLIGNLFAPAAVDRLLDEHMRRRKDHSRLIWALLTLQIWGKKNAL